MSIEQEIHGLALAVRELAAAIREGRPSPVNIEVALQPAAEQTPAKKPTRAPNAKESSAPTTSDTGNIQPAPSSAPAATPGEAKPVKLEDLRTALTNVTSSRGKDETRRILGIVGAAKLTDVKEADYARLLDEAQKVLQ